MLIKLLAPAIRALVSTVAAAIKALVLLLLLPITLLSRLQAGTLGAALLGCLFSTCVYVGLIASWGHQPRDLPATIRKRLFSSALACSLAWIPLYLDISHDQVGSRWISLTTALGLRSASVLQLWTAIACSLLHTCILFACPLVYTLSVDTLSMVEAVTGWLHALRVSINAADMQGTVDALLLPLSDQHIWRWRNLVAAPVTEEFVFRACMAPLLLRAGCSRLSTVLATPLFFGAAHLHHLREMVQHQGVALSSALMMVLAQFTYTTLFGWYATWLFIRTGTVWSPIAVHALCNWLGFPRFTLMAHHFGSRALAVGTAASIIGFILLLHPLTDPHRTGGPLIVTS